MKALARKIRETFARKQAADTVQDHPNFWMYQ